MSAEIVNLRRVRKASSRARREVQAAAARARHGRTKGERSAEALDAGRAERLLDGARRDDILRQSAPPPADAG